jgi:hypothetical protein
MQSRMRICCLRYFVTLIYQIYQGYITLVWHNLDHNNHRFVAKDVVKTELRVSGGDEQNFPGNKIDEENNG